MAAEGRHIIVGEVVEIVGEIWFQAGFDITEELDKTQSDSKKLDKKQIQIAEQPMILNLSLSLSFLLFISFEGHCFLSVFSIN